MPRRILHVDMDAFFASLEQRRRGIDGPVVVCVYSGRSEDAGAVSTASYGARELGIAAGMPIKRAKRVAEDADEGMAFVPVDKEYYRQVSADIRAEVFEEAAATVEQASIDEAYLDITERAATFDEAVRVAEQVQEGIMERFDLSCSIGVAPNKLVAKMASDRDKPGGLTSVAPDEVEAFMRSLELDDLHGVGEKSVERLEELGITSVEELADADRQRMVREFGEQRGLELIATARGADDAPVEERERQQLSCLTTLREDTRSRERLATELDGLADDLLAKVAEHEVVFGRVVLLAIDTGMQMHTRSTSLTTAVQDGEILLSEARDLLDRLLDETDAAFRRLGLRVAGLEDAAGQRDLTEF
ncbi:MAG: DNA polymerase IV [Candidatus Nanohaloarchaea archaeon]|nr:DNA polymerase IV [Candidatus Nanohaloarchaea archaeon]